jgi:hypothetical protein
MSERKRDAQDGREKRDTQNQGCASRLSRETRASTPLDEQLRFRVRGKRNNRG